jgi:hypothetical protein
MARVILATTQAADPPVRLLLGSDAIWLASKYAVARAAEDARWRDLSVSTDLLGFGDFSATAVGQLAQPPVRPDSPGGNGTSLAKKTEGRPRW